MVEPRKRSNTDGSLGEVNENCWKDPREVAMYSDATTP